MSLRLRILPLLALALVGAACTSASVTRYGPVYPARPENAFVGVFMSSGASYRYQQLIDNVGTPPGEPIARISVSGPPGSLPRDLIRRAKAEARELGGNAILVTASDDTYASLTATVYHE
jgi:hypothetical protein